MQKPFIPRTATPHTRLRAMHKPAWLPKGWEPLLEIKDKDAEIAVYTTDSYTLVDAAIRTTLPKTEIPEYHYERSIYFAPSDILAEMVEKLYKRSKYKLIKFLESLERFVDFIIGEVSDEWKRCLLVPESATSWYRLLRVSELRGYLCFKPEAVEHIKWLYDHGLLPFHWDKYAPIVISRARKILNPILDP